MRYVIKQKWFSLADKYFIRNENGADVFHVQGKVLSVGKKLTLNDMDSKEVASISQKVLAWGPTYHIYTHGELRATVKKKLFTLFRSRFEVDIPGPGDLIAQGSLLDHEYSITRGEEVVASISKKLFSLADTYGVDVREGEDDVLLLACAIVIDLAAQNATNASD